MDAGNARLPLDPSLHHGSTADGMQFYVMPSRKPKHTVDLRLVVAVGSAVEEESERGLAHYLEHMAFKGTASFDHGELIKFIESLGMQHGHHMNAHTGQFETVYKLTVPLGEAPGERLNAALAVLAEWATAVR